MNNTEIKRLLDKFAEEKDVKVFLTESRKQEIIQKLEKISSTDRSEVRRIIESVSIYIKESVDFSDTNYIIDQIVAAVNDQ